MTYVCYCYSSQKYTILPYVSFKGTNLPNHSYVDLTLVAKDGNDSVQCHTDLSMCCHADDGPTVETSTSIMALSCHSQVLTIYSTSLGFVKLSKLICDTEEEVMSHLVYIAALLRPMQSTMMMMVGRLVYRLYRTVCQWRLGRYEILFH